MITRSSLPSALLFALLALPSCKKEGGSEASAGDACADYVAAMEKCLEKTPADQRGPMKQQLDSQRSALTNAGEAAKEQMADGCRMGLATLKSDPRCE